MEVTYMLGAGASANALPVVAKLNEKLESFNKYLHSQFSDIPGLSELVGKLLENIKSHNTIDTYAKKLFLQERIDPYAKEELLQLKHYISLYFIAEQSKFYDEYYLNKTDKVGQVIDKRVRFTLSKLVDYRYDPFLASLLIKNNNRLVLPDNINIISWNYDSQLELAYIPFAKCGLEDAFKNLNVIPPNSNLERGSNVVKLNGTAGITKNNSEDVPSNYWGSNYANFSESDFRKSVIEFSNIDDEENDDLTMPVLNFAWEKDSNAFSQNAFGKACTIMGKTRILVVIGYTFPNFNREIDRGLMNALNGIEKIYYQAPEEELNGLIVRLKGIMPSNSRINGIEVIPYFDLKQFCIPFEL